MAAVLACAGKSSAAFLSHNSAAALWGLVSAEGGPVHVTVHGDSGRRRRPGIRLHRTQTLEPSMTSTHGGIPVTTPLRTIADLQAARRRERLSPAQLRRAVRQAAVLGYSIGDADVDGTRSELEHLFLRLCRRHRLPAPEVNAKIDSLEVDFLWRGKALVVETDGYRFHRGRTAFEDDRRRDLHLRRLGFQVIRLAYDHVSEPQDVAEALRPLATGLNLAH
jgi:very-short-patch-repair endonuclease